MSISFGMRHWDYQSFLNVKDSEQPGSSSTDKIWARGRLYLEDAIDLTPDAVGWLEFQTDKGLLKLAVKAELEWETVPAVTAKFKASGEVLDANPAQGACYELEGWAEVEDSKVAKIKGLVTAVRGSTLQPDKELGGEPIGTVGFFTITNPR